MDHDGCIILGFAVGFMMMGVIIYYLEVILRHQENMRPPVEFHWDDKTHYCRSCGREMVGAYDHQGTPATWVLDYCPDCIKRWR